MERALATITRSAEVMPGVHVMWIEAPVIACSARPGQFVTVRCGDFTLRRPLSIHYVSAPEIVLLFRIAGKGTLWLSQRQPGEKADVLGPLGNGFSVPPGGSGRSSNLLLVAGGMGIAPLAFLAQHAAPEHRINLIHGASTAGQIYPWALATTKAYSDDKAQTNVPPLPGGVQFVPVTEDGSAGKQGMVTDILPAFLDRVDQVYACGPLPMYEAMAGIACDSERSEESGGNPDRPREGLRLKRCQVSLEVRLGCGFGACYGCSIDTKRGLKRVCRDGPVFELDDIIWQEVKL